MVSLVIDREKCVGCKRCVPSCMKDNLEVVDRKVRETGKGCVGCGHCVTACPKGALRLEDAGRKEYDDPLVDFIMGKLSEQKSGGWLDGSMIPDADLEVLLTHGRRFSAEPVVISGDRLDAFMELAWGIAGDKADSIPGVSDWRKWRAGHGANEPNPVMWEGKQLLLIFARSPEDAISSSARLMEKGLTMCIVGSPSPTLSGAVRAAPDKVSEFFREIPEGKKPYGVYIIGRPRRLFAPPASIAKYLPPILRG